MSTSHPFSLMDLKTMASFPFLKEASEYLKNHPEEFPGIEEIAEDVLYSGVRERAMQRLNAALNREEIPVDFFSPEECREEILAYILARILVAAAGDRHLIRWYSLAEAVRAQRILQESGMWVVVLVAEELGMRIKEAAAGGGEGVSSAGERGKAAWERGKFGLAVADYLRLATGLKSMEWKLTNQPLKGGVVYLTKGKVARLVQEALKAKFEKELMEMKVPDSVRRLFSEQISEITGITSKLKESYDARPTSIVDPERFPPCIKNLIGMTQAGKNVPHSGRFAMTAFLHRIGMKTDDIVSLFRVSPDFREDLARYQVEHIAGSISGTEYESMSCKTMVTYGLCVGKDELCEKINHPLGYYEAKSDDAFPEGERRLRRALTASAYIARQLKIPVKDVQSPVQRWFREVARLELPTEEMPERETDEVKDYFDRVVDNAPALFRVKVNGAWLTGVKVTHPGTMEDIYPVTTTGLVEDSAGRVERLMPVLDFEAGRILRDFAKTGRRILISGQFFSFRKRRFLHVIGVKVGEGD